MNNTDRLDKFELLEARIAQAVQRLSELNDRCRSLAERNGAVEGELEELKKSNNDLAQQVVQLKAERPAVPKRNIDNKKILHSIDRMLEKFGELQI